MQIASSPPPIKLSYSISEPSAFNALCLPSSSSSKSSFNSNRFQSNAIKSSRRSRNRDNIASPCVDIIHLLESPVISSNSTSTKALSQSTSSLYQSEPGFKISKDLEVGRRKRRAVFTVAPDDNLLLSRDSSETIDREDAYEDIQGLDHAPSTGRGVGFADELKSPTKEPTIVSTDHLEIPLQDMKQWHALTEIVSTEVNYVYDLRKLAHVYFPALSALPLESSTSTAVQQLSDNVSGLLDFHESFLKVLQSVKTHGPSIESLDDAIENTAQLFISKASHFDLYKSFCSSQPEVLSMLREERSRLKAEWKLFEQHCAADGSELQESGVSLVAKDHNSSSETGPLSPASVKSACLSSPSPLPKGRVPSSSTFAFLKVSASSRGLSGTGSSGIQRSLSVDAVSSAGRKLRFHDYLIKPVQRICRYPILLQGLRRSKTHSERVDMVLAQALQSMHAVTTRVDEAQRIKEETKKSRLILNRIEAHSVISEEFLRSLGSCLFAGSLDIAYHHYVYNPIDPPIRVRYMAAFLFSGGYLLLAKVSKNRAYRIKYWFNAASFELVDIPEEEALVPHAFRLSRFDHHFEIAAACTLEKELWVESIRKAVHTSTCWALEPLSSLELMEHIPSAASSSYLQTDSAQLSPSKESWALTGDDQQRGQITTRPSIRIRTTAPSTTKLFAVGDCPPLLLKRSTAADRDLVDREMKDIQTSSITNCRNQAQTRGEIIFPPPKFAQTVQVMAMATTNKLMRRGSWLLHRPRNPGSSGTDQEETVAVVSPNRWSSRVGPSVAPNLSALHSEPECMDAVEEPASSNGHEPTITGSETTHDVRISDEGAANDSPKTPVHRRKNSFAASLKGLVRRGKSKRNSCQHIEDKLTTTITDDSQSRRRVSSAPPSPPQTQSKQQPEARGPSGSLNPPITNDIDGLPEVYQTIPTTASTSPLKPRCSIKRIIFRH